MIIFTFSHDGRDKSSTVYFQKITLMIQSQETPRLVVRKNKQENVDQENQLILDAIGIRLLNNYINISQKLFPR